MRKLPLGDFVDFGLLVPGSTHVASTTTTSLFLIPGVPLSGQPECTSTRCTNSSVFFRFLRIRHPSPLVIDANNSDTPNPACRGPHFHFFPPMATDDAMDVESATHGLYMDVERHPSPQNPPVSPSPASLNTSTPDVSRNPTAPYDPTPPPDFSQAVSLARRAVVAFLKESTAEEIIPEASRVALIDSTLTLKHAFRALVENGVKAAPVINISSQELCGTLSVSDILDALLGVYYSRSSEGVVPDLSEGLDDYTVRSWHAQQSRDHSHDDSSATRPFTYALSEGTLFDAVRIMRDSKVLYLPILSNEHMPLHALEHWRVMRFLHRHFTARDGFGMGVANSAASDPRHATRLFTLTLSQLNLGTYRNLITIPPSTPLLRGLQILQQHDLFAVPVVNERNQLVEVYGRADAALLASGGCDGNTLQRSIMDVLRNIRRGRPFVGVTCAREDMLGTVFERFERTGVQRMYVIGSSGVEGVVSLVTLLRYFLQGF